MTKEKKKEWLSFFNDARFRVQDLPSSYHYSNKARDYLLPLLRSKTALFALPEGTTKVHTI